MECLRKLTELGGGGGVFLQGSLHQFLHWINIKLQPVNHPRLCCKKEKKRKKLHQSGLLQLTVRLGEKLRAAINGIKQNLGKTI